MDYELAKELKDAGFPQEKCSSLIYQGKSEAIGCPTLEELIEKCGDGFAQLHRRWVNGTYHAFGGEYLVGPSKWQFELMDYPTADEAVARLWLTLNKKV
jgi:hypothetical protein